MSRLVVCADVGSTHTKVAVVDTAAGNAEARGVPVVATDNVLPRIGALCPRPARAAIREVFLRHVIGGRRLSRGPRFASLVRAATPDAVLAAAGLLAPEHPDAAVALLRRLPPAGHVVSP